MTGYDIHDLRARPGETLLLVNHVSHENSPYRASHAIFVGEWAREAALYSDRVPSALDWRVLSVRAFDRQGMMVHAALVERGDGDTAFRRMLADPAVNHLDAHNAARGCFAARLKRD